MKIIAETEGDDLVLEIFRNKDSNSDTTIKLVNHEEAIGVMIISMDDINEIINKTGGPDAAAWMAMSETVKHNCAKALMQNVFYGAKDQIEYAIADNFAIQMASPPTES